MLIIFAGDKASPRMKPGAEPFEGAACRKRLLEWIHNHVINISAPICYKIINQCDFSKRQLQVLHSKGATFVALGNNASKALSHIPHFKLPHPSGRNRQINDALFVKMKLAECRSWIKNQLNP